MASNEQRRALMAITCPWCQAKPGEACTRSRTTGGRRDSEGGMRKVRPQPVTVLDGNSHDARWQAAGLGTAPVLTDRLRELQPVAAAPARPAADDRPW